MEHRITLGEATVTCNDAELEMLKKVCLEFVGYELDELLYDEEYEPCCEFTFAELDTPQPNGTDFCICYWHGKGYRSNEIADRESQEEYGVYFSVLIFLSGCQEYFRMDHEGYNEHGFLSRGFGRIKNDDGL